jgi:hypothetical protein
LAVCVQPQTKTQPQPRKQSLAAAFPDTIDFVAVSHARCAADVAAARATLEGAGLGEAGVAAEINTAAALSRRVGTGSGRAGWRRTRPLGFCAEAIASLSRARGVALAATLLKRAKTNRTQVWRDSG